jgi:hypothetical protein
MGGVFVPDVLAAQMDDDQERGLRVLVFDTEGALFSGPTEALHTQAFGRSDDPLPALSKAAY